MPARLNTADYVWALRAHDCPADQHFIDWLEKTDTRNSVVFHFGTGGHHLVGRHNAEKGLNNSILGITASAEEYRLYMELASDHPDIARKYKAVFGDIYQLDPRLLPVFDVITLFHLGEFWTERNQAYGAMTELETVGVLAHRLRIGGAMIFYTQSTGFHAALPIIDALLESGMMAEAPRYETLRVLARV